MSCHLIYHSMQLVSCFSKHRTGMERLLMKERLNCLDWVKEHSWEHLVSCYFLFWGYLVITHSHLSVRPDETVVPLLQTRIIRYELISFKPAYGHMTVHQRVETIDVCVVTKFRSVHAWVAIISFPMQGSISCVHYRNVQQCPENKLIVLTVQDWGWLCSLEWRLEIMKICQHHLSMNPSNKLIINISETGKRLFWQELRRSAFKKLASFLFLFGNAVQILKALQVMYALKYILSVNFNYAFWIKKWLSFNRIFLIRHSCRNEQTIVTVLSIVAVFCMHTITYYALQPLR